MAGDCALEAKALAADPSRGRPLIESVGTPPRTVEPAISGSEPQIIAQAVGSWIGRNPLPGDPPNAAWTNLRSIQGLLAGTPGIRFAEGFPTSGPVSIEMMERILTSGTHGNDRITEVPDWKRNGLHEGDIVAYAPPQQEIGRQTCGLRASLGVVQRNGTVAKFNGDKAQIVAATEFFSQPDVRVFRLEHH